MGGAIASDIAVDILHLPDGAAAHTGVSCFEPDHFGFDLVGAFAIMAGRTGAEVSTAKEYRIYRDIAGQAVGPFTGHIAGPAIIALEVYGIDQSFFRSVDQCLPIGRSGERT